MHKTNLVPHVVFIFLFCSLAFPGCSLIGFGIGAAADQGIPGAPLMIPGQLDSLTAGEKLRIIRKDLTEINGTYEARGQVRDTVYSMSEYPHAFEQWRLEPHRDITWMPAFGESVRVAVRTPQGEKMYGGSFAGFDPGVIRIFSHPQEQLVGIKLDCVRGVFDSLGRTLVTGETLVNTVGGGVPFATSLTLKPGIILRSKSGLSAVSIDDITAVNRLEPGNGKWTGLAIGAALDVAVIILAAASWHLTFPSGSWRF